MVLHAVLPASTVADFSAPRFGRGQNQFTSRTQSFWEDSNPIFKGGKACCHRSPALAGGRGDSGGGWIDDIRRLAAYTEGTAGAIMTSDYAPLAPDLNSRDAIEVLRREASDTETIYRAYVFDRDCGLTGSVRFQNLILASVDTKVADLMERDPLAVALDEDQEDVARKIARYVVLARPVVAADERLVGSVTHDDASIGFIYRKRINYPTVVRQRCFCENAKGCES